MCTWAPVLPLSANTLLYWIISSSDTPYTLVACMHERERRGKEGGREGERERRREGRREGGREGGEGEERKE